jgi:hypothetical protein
MCGSEARAASDRSQLALDCDLWEDDGTNVASNTVRYYINYSCADAKRSFCSSPLDASRGARWGRWSEEGGMGKSLPMR